MIHGSSEGFIGMCIDLLQESYYDYMYFIVGGIYTVIRSKAPVTVEELKNQYCLIGPYKEHNVNMEVEVCEPPNNAIKEAIAELEKDEIKVTF
jgi:glycogen(starch) synthase